MAALRRPLALLPEGIALPEDIWRSRHRGVCALLWLHVFLLPIVGVLRHKTLVDAVLGAGAVGLLAAIASRRGLGRDLRTSSATLGLVMSSAILVHLFDGLIEMHFHFFVMVVVISLYQSWRPFLLALGFVVLHHSIGGATAAGSVYAHPPAQAWAWALVHGGFVLAQSLACLVCWRASENTLDRERQAREDLSKAHQDLTAAQALAGVGSWDWDVPAALVSWSDQLYAIAGLHRDSFTPTVESFLALVRDDDRDRVAALIEAALEHHSPLDYEFRLVRPDGTVRVVHALGECAVDEPGGLVKMFGTCQDITERKLLHEKIEHLAFHDPLTGLANRALFLNRLEHALAVQQRSARTCAVLFLDLDGFKTINDTLGHSAGDKLLVEVGLRLQASVRGHDTVARLGGDEFAVLLESVDLPTAIEIAQRIHAALGEPVPIEGSGVSAQASIGIALSGDTTRPDDILRNADAAMYTAKRQGKNRHSIFPSALVRS